MENVHVLYLSKYIHVAREMQKLPLNLTTMHNDVRAFHQKFKWHKISKGKWQRNEPERQSATTILLPTLKTSWKKTGATKS